MIKLLALTLLGVAAALLVSKLFTRKNEDPRERELNEPDRKPRDSNLLPIFLLGVLAAGLLLIVLPRFGVSVVGLIQKLLSFMPLVRAFLPF